MMMDLDGKIVFKVKLDKEIKKIVIHNEDINFNELLLMMQRIFSDKIKPNDEFSIKYTDEENDLITLDNDSDVSLALQDSKILKLTLFLKEENETSAEEVKPSEIVDELKKIRMSIDRFLDKFAGSLKLNEKSSETKEQDLSIVTNGLHISSSANNLFNNESHKEFDPLNNRQKQEQPAESVQRTDTPASLNSLELSSGQLNVPSNGPQQQQQHHQQQQPQQQQPQQNSQFMQIPSQQNNFNPSPSNQQPNQFYNQPQPTYQPVPQMPQARPQMPQAAQAQVYPNQQPTQQQQQQQQAAKPQQFQGQYPQSQPQAPVQPQLQQQQQQPSKMDQQQGFNMNQYYQQQHQQQQQNFGQGQPTFMPQQPSPSQNFMGGPPVPQQQQPGSMNPYAKPANVSLARPPSATAYSQGYK